MFLEILGFILSSFVIAVLIASKWTTDIHPFVLKRYLTRLALLNWAKRKDHVKLFNSPPPVPKCTEDLGMFASNAEQKIENVQSLGIDDLDDLMIYGIDDKGNVITAQITRSYGNKSDCSLYIWLNGMKYSINRSNVNSSSDEFSCANFKLELVEPLRTWRIWYNGITEQEDVTSGNSTLVHATLNFLWKALENPQDARTDFNVELLSTYLINGSFGSNLADLRSILPKGYSQFGTIHGIIKIDEIEMPALYLYGFRTRRFLSRPSTSKSGSNRLELFGMCGADGNAFKLEAMNDGWTNGQMYYASYQVNPILNVSEAQPSDFLSSRSFPKLFNINDKVKCFRIEIWPHVMSHKFSKVGIEVTSLRLHMNGKDGRGFLLHRNFDTCHGNLDIPREPISRLVGQEHFTGKDAVHFDSDLCLLVSLVGGKGASLAKLTRIAKKSRVEFQTAKGFCLTTELFTKILDVNKIKEIFLTAYSKFNLEEACSKVVKLIKSSGAEEKIQSIIKLFMVDQFGNENKLRFAVRSSGILEDASELSCAGQNETFLGVPADSVPEKVLHCWASLFTTQSVLYRLNHGQPAMSTMGVVIQEMVDAQAAGVIFSADPRTGNPFEMIISANFGLGESVVSASCDPDNITILRSRNLSKNNNNNDNGVQKKVVGELSIGKKFLGGKKSKIEMSQDGLSTNEVLVDESKSQEYSISDETALNLGKIVVEIENLLEEFKPIDVEWAKHKNGTVYILQSRNITALDSWTEFEIIHEMDSALRTTFERNTTANTGEVMPGISSALSTSVMTRALDVSIQRRMAVTYNETFVPYMIRSCSVARQKLFLNVINLFYKQIDAEIGAAQVALDLSVFGHRVITEELHRIGVERFGVTPGRKRLAFIAKAAKNVRGSNEEVKRVDKKYASYCIDLGSIGFSSKTIFQNITQRFYDLYDICHTHCQMSEDSGFTQMFAFLTLAGSKHVDAWDADLFEDVSKILAVCSDVESADMPSAMDELATDILDHGKILEDFIESPPLQALEWLRSNNTLSASLDKFFGKHGHRCISELDLSRPSWETEPTPFIQLLQSIVRSKVKAKETWKSSAQKPKYANDTELLNDLKTPLTSGSKRFLKFILYYCRNAVVNRERTKSLLVRTGDQLKQAYVRLAQVMTEEHLIHDEKLLPFLTHHEIGLIISGHPTTPRILYKALRRQKVFPVLNKDQYPEISVGMIEPINQGIPLELGDSIQATPLSTGKVHSTVKVCLNVEEAAHQIQPGDILVTIGTDIGWSPFFPLLGGIVTELGGLISHGAVVAREYGLPCIVGATNATKIFKSGEQVILDAGKGTLTKLKG